MKWRNLALGTALALALVMVSDIPLSFRPGAQVDPLSACPTHSGTPTRGAENAGMRRIENP